MKIEFEINETINIGIYQAFHIDLRKSLFFDIETTGFSASHTTLYLIGVCYYDSKSQSFRGIQWFNEDGTQESKILSDFLEFATNYDILIHYNGDGFDLPYLKSKAEQFHLTFTLEQLQSFDIYKQCRLTKSLLCLDHIKLKCIEEYLNLNREDTKNGGELIKFYQTYIAKPNALIKQLLLLHNRDDIKGLLQITPILSYNLLLQNEYIITHLALKDSTAYITLSLNYPLPKRISKGKKEILLTAYQDTATLRIPIYQEELKFFYPNYKDYYYLPLEDTAIHKSVAFYVDKEYRTQAKAATCYSRKTGLFLPQFDTIVSPYFKREYNDKISYFELTEENCNNPDILKEYVSNILSVLL